MQTAIQNETQKRLLYSVDEYQGQGKWWFALVLNKAKQNLDEDKNKELPEHSLLRFNKTRKEEWFNDETQKLIRSNKEEISSGFTNVRNYFSHHLHTEDCLLFEKESPLRNILEQAYKKACFECKRKNTEMSVEFPLLFEDDNRITSAGVVLLTSFFVERRYLHRLIGSIKGFKNNKGQYNLIRNVFSTYCLRDSYSIQGQDKNAVQFRNILGYLLRIPSEAYQNYYPNEPNEEGDSILNERKTDKFITFALHYLEDFPPAGYQLKFARRKIERPQVKPENKDKPHKKKAKVKAVFNGYDDNAPYYISHNNVIMKITKGESETNCKIGVNELKYLVLLFMKGKGPNALEKIFGFCDDMKIKYKNINGIDRKELKRFPRYVLDYHGLMPEKKNRQEPVEARADYIRKKWEKKRKESKQARLNNKAGDILRYLNECCTRPMNVDEYNKIFEILINKNFEGFENELSELVKTERIAESKIEGFTSLGNLEKIHQMVCELIIEKLEQLQGDELLRYIGLEKKDLRKTDEQINKEKGESKFENKIEKLKPVLCKGFLRYTFFRDSSKKFWELVQETLKQTGTNDVLIDKKYYKIEGKKLYDKANLVLWETLARDRLCMMTAWEYFKTLNERLADKSERLEWVRKDRITLTLKAGDREKKVHFTTKDFAKLYVMDNPDFLRKLIEYFLDEKTNEIEYHKLYSEGLNRYSDLQKECMTAILEFEEKVIREKNLRLQGDKTHFPFWKILENWAQNKDDKSAEPVNKVRKSIFHHNLNFERSDLRTFYEVMKREGIERKWPLKL